MTSKTKKHFNIKVFGRVQKVGFRFNAKNKADKFRITGFVKNLPNKSVYIEAEGFEEDLDRFLDFLKKGPFFAKVKRIEKGEGKIINFRNFKIKF
jgi:acylphosphatase